MLPSASAACAFDPKLAEQEFDRTEVIRDAFARYDHNGSGVLSATEWRQMLRELCESSDFKPEDMDLERWPTDLQKWAQHEFLKADANGDGVVTLLEFTRYYHTMHEFLRHRLAKSAKTNTIRKQLAEAFLEARSFRRPLSVVLGALEGVLLLDAYGHDYGVELYFSQDECARAECDATRWVRAQTLLDSKVDAYTDPSNTIGEIRFAPIVQIEFESDGDASGASGASPPCVLTMPHCFDLEDLEMEDIVVVTAQMSMTGAKGEWSIVDPARVRLINPPGLSDSSCFVADKRAPPRHRDHDPRWQRRRDLHGLRQGPHPRPHHRPARRLPRVHAREDHADRAREHEPPLCSRPARAV